MLPIQKYFRQGNDRIWLTSYLSIFSPTIRLTKLFNPIQITGTNRLS